MGGAERNVDRAALRDRVVGAVDGDNACALDDEPMLGAPLVTLVAQPLAGQHLDALDLVVGCVGEDGVAAPRTFVVLHRGSLASRLPERQRLKVCTPVKF